MKSRAQVAVIGVKRVSSDKSDTGQFFFGKLAFGRFNSGEFILPDTLGVQLVPLQPSEENPVLINLEMEIQAGSFVTRDGKQRSSIETKIVGGEVAAPGAAQTGRRAA